MQKKCKCNAKDMHKDLKRIANQCRRNTMKLSQERIRDANNTQLNTKNNQMKRLCQEDIEFLKHG